MGCLAVWDVWLLYGVCGLYGLYGVWLYGHTKAWDKARGMYGPKKPFRRF